MSRLDRDRYPVRFAVTTTIVGGLALFAIERALEVASRVIVVPWWSVLAAAGVLSAAGLVAARQTRQGCAGKRVFLIISAFSQQYLAEMLRNLHRVLDHRGYELVVKIPERDYSSRSQVRHLQGILRRRRDYLGGFIVPAEVAGIRGDLAEFCAKAAMPVVFMDDEPFAAEQDYPANTAYVGYDAGEIGAAAAEWVIGYLGRSGEPAPAVLAIGGVGYQSRQHRFMEVLRGKVASVQIVEDTAEFDRSCARDVVSKHLNRFRATGQVLRVIFCANDEMALGAVDALLCAEHRNGPETVVVGVDGSPQARALIDSGTTPLRATVVQDSYRVAETAVDLLERLRQKQKTTTRTLLPPTVRSRE
jgi:ABC-type sugar transport system substrate-binding protein